MELYFNLKLCCTEELVSECYINIALRGLGMGGVGGEFVWGVGESLFIYIFQSVLQNIFISFSLK